MRTEPIPSTYGHTHLDCMLSVFGSPHLRGLSLDWVSCHLPWVSAAWAPSYHLPMLRCRTCLCLFGILRRQTRNRLHLTSVLLDRLLLLEVACDQARLRLTCSGSVLLPVDYAALGSSSFVRNHARSGSTISVQETIQLNRDRPLAWENTYIKYGTTLELNEDNIQTLYDTIQVYARAIDGTSKRGIGIRGGGGRLHGSWVADNTVSTSDRRLKKSIIPLYKAIETEGEDGSQASSVSWVLRQLRPVSFKFKQGPEAKYSRYGFVAQELQQVLPSLVRKVEDDHLADLIALLTAAAQMLQEKVTKQEEKISKLELELNKLNAKMDLLLAGQSHKVPDIAV
eukprot:s5108_g5.t1